MNGPLIAIVGPTASGKTDLAIEAARAIGGEIIAADSRTVYKGLDIGTAKPTPKEQVQVPHHLLDVVSPDQPFTAAEFQRLAYAAIADIQSRGRVPMLVGGTGLYVDSVLFDYSFSAPADPDLRAKLNEMELEELVQECIQQGIDLPENPRNKRHVIRAIEQGGINKKRNFELPPLYIVVGLSTDRQTLQKRITARADKIFAQPVVNEATEAANLYGWDNEAMTGNIYPLIRKMLDGEITEVDAKELFIRSDMQLAKRQMTWFKRNRAIEWFDDKEQALARIKEFADALPRSTTV